MATNGSNTIRLTIVIYNFKPYHESIPLLSLCEYQEKETLRQESGQERLDWDLVVSYTTKAIMNDTAMERLIDTLMKLQKREHPAARSTGAAAG